MELHGGGDNLRSPVSNQSCSFMQLDKNASTSKQFSKNLVTGNFSILKPHGTLSARSALGSEQRKKFSPFLCQRAISFESLTREEEKGMATKEIFNKIRSPVQKQQEALITMLEFDQQSATRICQVVYLNSWRKGHTRLESIKSEMKHMQTRTDNLKEQNAAFLQILHAQGKRMTGFVTEKKEKSVILTKYNQVLAALAKENSTRYSKCKELEDRIERSEKMYETKMGQKNKLMEEINKIEKDETDTQKKINDLNSLMAALKISRITQQKQILVNEENISKFEQKIERAFSTLTETQSSLTLILEKVNEARKTSVTGVKDCDDLELAMSLEDAFRRNDIESFAIFKEIRQKEVLAAQLWNQLRELELEEATRRDNYAYYLVSKLGQLILYIVTQQVI